jgi:hypothetical protein
LLIITFKIEKNIVQSRINLEGCVCVNLDAFRVPQTFEGIENVELIFYFGCDQNFPNTKIFRDWFCRCTYNFTRIGNKDFCSKRKRCRLDYWRESFEKGCLRCQNDKIRLIKKWFKFIQKMLRKLRDRS